MNSTGQALCDFEGWQPYGHRMTAALVLSLLLHALLLSLAFGGRGSWLPGVGFPWHERSFDGAHLQVALEQVARDSARLPDSSVSSSQLPAEPWVPDTPTTMRPPPATGSFVAGITREAHPAEPDREAKAGAKAAITPKPAAKGRATARREAERRQTARSASTTSPPDAESAPDSAREHAAPRIGQGEEMASPPVNPPAVNEATASEELMSVAPIMPSLPAPAPAPAEEARAFNPQSARPSLPSRVETGQARIGQEPKEQAATQATLELQRQQQVEAQREEAAQQAAARAEDARVTAERQETARAEALRIDAAKTDAAKNEVAKADAARVEAARVEAARAAAAKADAATAQAVREAAARAEVARVEAARAEAARAEATRAEATRAEVARAEAARAEAARAEVARSDAAQAARAEVERAREERLRAIGRQLDEERDRREAAAKLPPTYTSLRRYRLFGRADSNQEIILYAEAWARKIQLNTTIEMVREIAKQPHTDPLVTVAVRSDGSVETITFVRSSGVAGIDDAIRRVVENQTPYQAFPPNLAREYDVIEIRRTWRFDTAVRLE